MDPLAFQPRQASEEEVLCCWLHPSRTKASSRGHRAGQNPSFQQMPQGCPFVGDTT